MLKTYSKHQNELGCTGSPGPNVYRQERESKGKPKISETRSMFEQMDALLRCEEALMLGQIVQSKDLLQLTIDDNINDNLNETAHTPC